MAYSKQNFQNGQILNAANLEAMENGIIAGQGAHNLLDNSDFRNPVNQRGKNTYSDAGNEYTIDRWKTQYGTNISIENGYINIFGQWQLYQSIQNPKDGIYTFAARIRINSIGKYTPNIYVSDGSISNEILLDANTGEWKTYILQYDLSSTTAETISFSLSPRGGDTTASISVEWAAMYKGAYTVDTLPPYVPKGKHVEMLNCNVPLAPHNLLDNSDFTNPVNQRGQTTYTGSRYSIDRWRTWNNDATITLTSEGIKGGGTNASVLYQVIELHKIKLGTSYTVAAGYSDGTITCNAGTLTTSSSVGIWNSEEQVYLMWNNGTPQMRLWHATKTIQWAAIYPGSYTASTLPAYRPKGYSAELAECQRYYRRFINSAPAISTAATAIEAEMPLEPPMRVVPTITINSVGPAYTPEGTKSVSGSYSATNTVNKAGYVFYTPSIGIGLPCVITGIDGYLSADL